MDAPSPFASRRRPSTRATSMARRRVIGGGASKFGFGAGSGVPSSSTSRYGLRSSSRLAARNGNGARDALGSAAGYAVDENQALLGGMYDSGAFEQGSSSTTKTSTPLLANSAAASAVTPEGGGASVPQEQHFKSPVPSMSLYDMDRDFGLSVNSSSLSVRTPQSRKRLSMGSKLTPSMRASGATPRSLNRSGIDLGYARGFDLASPLPNKTASSSVTPSMSNDFQSGGASAGHFAAALQPYDVAESPWVTIFGYPAGAGEAVLAYFQKFGEVHQHRSEAGNWTHILYASKLQAARALAYNGRTIRTDDGVYMIGVKRCIKTGLPTLADVAEHATPLSGKAARKRRAQVSSFGARASSSAKQQRRQPRSKSVCTRIVYWLLDW